MPDLLRKTWDEAKAELLTLGWTGQLAYGGPVAAEPPDIGRILAQDPPAGARVPKGTDVALQMGSPPERV